MNYWTTYNLLENPQTIDCIGKDVLKFWTGYSLLGIDCLKPSGCIWLSVKFNLL